MDNSYIDEIIEYYKTRLHFYAFSKEEIRKHKSETINYIMIVINSILVTISLFFSAYNIVTQFSTIPRILVLIMILAVSLLVFGTLMYINWIISDFRKIEDDQYNKLNNIEHIIYSLYLLKTKWSSKLKDEEIRNILVDSMFVSMQEYRKMIDELLNRLNSDENKESQAF